ncbi:MAG: hypothetical protein WBZ29_03775 [Methanocella sp.]
MKDDKGQIMLLSALAACACLIVLATYLYSISASYPTEQPALQREVVDNIVWVQDAGLLQAAGETGGCQWEQCVALAGNFKARAYIAVSSIEESMIARGIAYSFEFNESLASKYLDDSDMSSVENIGGVLIKRETGNASVCGCAYDVSLTDGSSRFSISTVKTWA